MSSINDDHNPIPGRDERDNPITSVELDDMAARDPDIAASAQAVRHKTTSSPGSPNVDVPTISRVSSVTSENASLPALNAASGASMRSVEDTHLQDADASASMLSQTSGSLHAADIPLPSSSSSNRSGLPSVRAESDGDGRGSASSSHSESLSFESPPRSDPPSYWDLIASLLDYFPELRCIQPERGRYPSVGRLLWYEYDEDYRPLMVVPFELNADQTRMRAQMEAEPDLTDWLLHMQDRYERGGQRRRLLLVQDLCPISIEAIGSVFKVDPGFFAKHLERGGYDMYDHDEEPVKQYSTSAAGKQWSTISWFRPVMMNTKVTDWLRKSEVILNRPRSHFGSNVTTFERLSWVEPKYLPDNSPNPDRRRHDILPSTNIFRTCWPLTSRLPSSVIDDAAPSEPSPDGVPENVKRRRNRMFPMAWQEKVSVYECDSTTVPTRLFDAQTLILQQRRDGRSAVRDFDLRLQPVKMGVPMSSRIVPTLPSNRIYAGFDDLERYRFETDARRSIIDAVQGMPMIDGHHNNPLAVIFRIVANDNRAFQSALADALAEIAKDSLDDFLMVRRSAGWRRMMNDMQVQIPLCNDSVNEFQSFLDRIGIMPPVASDYIDEIHSALESSQLNLDQAYTGLRTDMQFTESRRSINEAKAVTKLTELAFLFVPLSFAASLFSMSVQGLAGNPVPVWYYIVTAIGLSVLAYIVRWLLTSDYLADRSRTAIEAFWAENNIRRGESIPFTTMVLITAREIWKRGGAQIAQVNAIVVAATAVIIVPIVFMWTTNSLGTSFHVVVTLCVFLTAIVLAITLPFGDDSLLQRILLPHGLQKPEEGIEIFEMFDGKVRERTTTFSLRDPEEV